jgi:predicted negative regulator of RcsB-dependent stress response
MNDATVTSLAPADTPAALKPLLELPLPEPVSWAPQTIGWVVVAVLLIAAMLWAGWMGWRRHKRERYRRVALAELAEIEAALIDAQRRTVALAAIPSLIKRTSLAAAPRERVAALSGDEWLAFLKRTRGRFDERSGALLALVSYAPAEQIASITALEVETLVSATRDWIQRHHVEI